MELNLTEKKLVKKEMYSQEIRRNLRDLVINNNLTTLKTYIRDGKLDINTPLDLVFIINL